MSTIISFDNAIYSGQILNNKRHGTGRILLKDNSIYEGDWYTILFRHEDNIHGHGTILFSEKNEKFCGEWQSKKLRCNNMMVKGVYEYSDGSKYDGTFLGQQRQGFGKMVTDQYEYEGYWINNMFEGIGKIIYINGDSYEGDFLKNFKHGQGRIQFSNGDIFIGNFENDLMQGEGELFQANQIKKGIWIKGIQVSQINTDLIEEYINDFSYEEPSISKKDIKSSNNSSKRLLSAKSRSRNQELYDKKNIVCVNMYTQIKIASMAKQQQTDIINDYSIPYQLQLTREFLSNQYKLYKIKNYKEKLNHFIMLYKDEQFFKQKYQNDLELLQNKPKVQLDKQDETNDYENYLTINFLKHEQIDLQDSYKQSEIKQKQIQKQNQELNDQLIESYKRQEQLSVQLKKEKYQLYQLNKEIKQQDTRIYAQKYKLNQQQETINAQKAKILTQQEEFARVIFEYKNEFLTPKEKDYDIESNLLFNVQRSKIQLKIDNRQLQNQIQDLDKILEQKEKQDIQVIQQIKKEIQDLKKQRFKQGSIVLVDPVLKIQKLKKIALQYFRQMKLNKQEIQKVGFQEDNQLFITEAKFSSSFQYKKNGKFQYIYMQEIAAKENLQIISIIIQGKSLGQQSSISFEVENPDIPQDVQSIILFKNYTDSIFEWKQIIEDPTILFLLLDPDAQFKIVVKSDSIDGSINLQSIDVQINYAD